MATVRGKSLTKMVFDDLIKLQQKLSDEKEDIRNDQRKIQAEIDKRLEAQRKQAEDNQMPASQTLSPLGIESEEDI